MSLPGSNWTAVWVLFAGGLTAGAQLTKVPPALPGLRAELGLTLVQSGFIQTAVYAVGAAIAVFFGGWFAHRELERVFDYRHRVTRDALT